MATPGRVSVWKYLGLFALVYLLLTIFAAFIIHAFFEGKPIKGINVVCIGAAAMAAGYAFVRKHGRPFEGAEYWTVLGGSIAVNVLYQLVPAMPVLLAGKIPIGAFTIAMGIVVVLHGLLLAFLYSPRMVSRYGPKPNP